MDYKVVRLTSEYIPGAQRVLRKSFFPDEKVCNCTRVLTESEVLEETNEYKLTKSAKELEHLCLDCIKDGVSFCCIDIRTGEVLGVAINKIQVKPPEGQLSYFEDFAEKNIKDAPALGLVDFMVDADSRFDLFAHCKSDCLLEIMFLAVLFEAKGRGIGQAVVQASIDLAQQMRDKNLNQIDDIDITTDAKEYGDSEALKKIPACVSAIFTSRFSQRVGKRVNMAVVLEIPYTEFEYKGKKYIETTGPEHPSCALSCRLLE